MNIFSSIVKTVICVFHMPAFFIISGILMNPKKLKNQTFTSFVNRKIKRLIIPYVLFEIVGGILQMFLYGIDEVNFVDLKKTYAEKGVYAELPKDVVICSK